MLPGEEYPEPEKKTENEGLVMLRRVERKLDVLLDRTNPRKSPKTKGSK